MAVCWVHKLFARIGQGCECRSVCCGHAGRQLLEQGSVSTVLVNCRPEFIRGYFGCIFMRYFGCIFDLLVDLIQEKGTPSPKARWCYRDVLLHRAAGQSWGRARTSRQQLS